MASFTAPSLSFETFPLHRISQQIKTQGQTVQQRKLTPFIKPGSTQTLTNSWEEQWFCVLVWGDFYCMLCVPMAIFGTLPRLILNSNCVISVNTSKRDKYADGQEQYPPSQVQDKIMVGTNMVYSAWEGGNLN